MCYMLEDPAEMTPNQRRREVAAILAAGVLRLNIHSESLSACLPVASARQTGGSAAQAGKMEAVEEEPGSEAQKTETQPTTGAEGTTPAQTVEAGADPAAEIRAAAAAEQERINAIRKVCGQDHGEIAAKAIAEGWDATRTELEVLRASRPRAPAVHVAETSVTGQVLEAACLLTAGLGDVEKLHDEKTLDVAARRFRGGIGLQELLLEAAWANGYTGRNFRDSRSVLRYAFGRDIQATGFSTVDIGGYQRWAEVGLIEGWRTSVGYTRTNIAAGHGNRNGTQRACRYVVRGIECRPVGKDDSPILFRCEYYTHRY